VSDAPAGFRAFWVAYPRRVGYGAAVRAWAVAEGETRAAEIVAAVEAQRAGLVAEGLRFCPHPATWLNQRRWLDEPGATAPGPVVATEKTRGNAAALARFIQREDGGASQ